MMTVRTVAATKRMMKRLLKKLPVKKIGSKSSNVLAIKTLMVPSWTRKTPPIS
jgi:hypothetical protein